MLPLPQDTIRLILCELVPQEEEHDQSWRDIKDNKERNKTYWRRHDLALEQADALVNATLVCKSWRASAPDTLWQRVWHSLPGHDQRRQQRSWQCYRAQIYCKVRVSQLSQAIRSFVKQEKLVYRSPKAQRRYDTDKLGMRKLIKLGKDKLWSHKKEKFIAMSCEWKRVHQLGIDIDDALRPSATVDV